MKIAIMVFHFPPYWVAGSEIAAYKLANYLTRKGHEVHVITRNPTENSLESNNLQTSSSNTNNLPTTSNQDEYDFNLHQLKITKNRFLEHLDYWIKSFFLLRKINPDLIHFQSMFIALPSSIMKFLLRKPVVLSGRGSDIYHFAESNFLKLIYRSNLKNADAVVVLTEHMQRAALKIYNREIFVIPNGIETGRFSNRARIKNTNSWKIIYAGGLRKVKGVKYLIKAIETITSKKYNVNLTVVGDGEEYSLLQNLVKDLDISESVEFRGWVDNEEIPKYLDSSDVLVLPSLSEGFPNIVLEAMASGLPIIGTNITGMNEIIENGKNGFLVEPGSSEQISEKLLKLMDDKDLFEDISRNNLTSVKKYELDHVMGKLEKIYSELIINI